MKNGIMFLDEYDDLSRFLMEAIRYVEPGYQTIVMKDIPFLPSDIMSVYEYIIARNEKEEQKEKELQYAFLPLPEFWEVRPEGYNGAVYNMGEKQATIFFREPEEKRIVQRVEWLTSTGTVYKIDYYNRYGYAYCTSLLNESGVEELKSYYTSTHEEVILVNASNGVVTLFREGHAAALFPSEEAFEQSILKEIIQEKERIVLTSGRQAKWMAESGTDVTKQVTIALQKAEDVRICQEKQYHQALHCPLLVFSNWNTKECLVDEARGEYRVCYALEKYPSVKGSAEALILTASDALTGIERLTELLPKVTFHIAANTQVSQKLIDLAKRANVFVYPQVSEDKLRQLCEQCDFYLDINEGREIYHAILRAVSGNMLIVGVRSRLHNSDYVLEECVFDEGNEEAFAGLLQRLAENKEELERMTTWQQEKGKASVTQRMR